MKLFINGEPVAAEESADKTVLQFVRERGLTGTKEGCASGDCGACTVMVGAFDDEKVKYQTVNSCIVPIGQLAGKHLVTVEGLANGAALHPAQQAMVDCHGSQCGFCTPGFVMSLATLLEQGAAADRDTVLQGISGNLCRCTGYRPIVEAGLKALQQRGNSTLAPASMATRLPDIDSESVLRPLTETALQQLLADNPGVPIIAGGTDLMLEVTQRFASMPMLIDVSHVKELQTVTEPGDTLVIGAAVTYSLLESVFQNRSLAMVELLHRLGSRQIRNSGTMGGNLANGSPIADIPPALIVLEAAIELVSSNGGSRRVSVPDFYTDYRQTVLGDGEYIARIHIPKSSLQDFHRFYKSSKRIEDDISSVMGAFRFTGDSARILQARIAYGGMAATPIRLEDVESILASAPLDNALVEQALTALNESMTPMTDVRASADYRRAMAASMLERALAEWRGEARLVITAIELHG